MTPSGTTHTALVRPTHRRRVLNKVMAWVSLVLGVLAISIGAIALIGHPIYPGAW